VSHIRRSGVIALAAVLFGIGAFGVANAQQPSITLQMKVTENRAPGAAGTVTLTALSATSGRVDIRITGLMPNATFMAHIHAAPDALCDNGKPVVYPLTAVRSDAAGVGTSTTTININANSPIRPQLAYINVHEANGSPGQGIICADVTSDFSVQLNQAAQGGGAAGGGTPGQPRVGTGSAAESATRGWMIAGLAALAMVFGGAGTLAVARRRR
jgi:hypothetical protein